MNRWSSRASVDSAYIMEADCWALHLPVNGLHLHIPQKRAWHNRAWWMMQALAMQPPLYPGELFREMVLGAMVNQPPPEEAADDQEEVSVMPTQLPGIKNMRMVAPKRYRGEWDRIGKEMYDTYGPPEKYGLSANTAA